MARPLFPVLLFFCTGILLSRWITTSVPALVLTVAFFLLASWTAYYREKGKLCCSLLLLTFTALGLLVPPLHESSYPQQHLRTLARSGKLDLSQPCRVTGICSAGSIPRGIGEQIELSVEKIENRSSTFATEGRVRLALYYQKTDPPKRLLIAPGERIELLAYLRLPKNFNNPGQFDHVAYLERKGIALVGTIKNELLITRLATGEGNFLSRGIHLLRSRFIAELEESFPESEDVLPVLKALLLGDKQTLPPQVEKQFQATGLYHVLVVSGQHVAIMAVFLWGLFRVSHLPRTLNLLLTMAGLMFYSVLTEAQTSVTRATIMACVFLLVVQFDRDRSLLNSLSLAAGCLLWTDPFWLFDPGFQLSFLAVLAIALIGLPLMNEWTKPWRSALLQVQDPAFDGYFKPVYADFRIWLRLRIELLRARVSADPWNLCGRLAAFPFRTLLYLADLLILSFAIQLVFAVLMVIYFHRVSLTSSILNTLAVPLMGLIVPLGFLLLLSSLVWQPLQQGLATCCSLLVQWLLYLANAFAAAGWGNFRLPSPPIWVLVTYFLCLSLALVPFSKRTRLVWGVLAAGSLALLLCYPFTPRTPTGVLQFTFLDVRQGDSILASFPDRSHIVVDGGGLLGRSFGEYFGEDRFDVGEQVVSPFLWSQGIRRLDALVLTHAHHDHMAGLKALLENFEVGELWVGQNPLVPEYVNLLKSSLRKSVPIRTFSASDRLNFHSTSLEFLNPARNARIGSVPTNNDSLTFQLQFKDRRFLLTGDIEKRIETEILRDGRPLTSDLLKVAHHGSKSSTSPEFLDRAQPIWAVISVAEHSPFGHPHPEVLQRLVQRGIPVFRTDRDGAVTVTTDGKRLEVRCYQPTASQHSP
jgi:competence protein ComEC